MRWFICSFLWVSLPVFGAVVEWEISPGHGESAWNTAESALEIRFGDTLRIINLDESARHGLHSFGEPCPHGGDRLYNADGELIQEGRNVKPIPVGGWAECDFDTPPSGDTYRFYNHFSGPRAPFFVELID